MGGFRYGQFGEGFSRSRVRAAMRFSQSVNTRGQSILIIKKTVDSYDDYGDPVYSETSYSLNVFFEESGREQVLQIGDLRAHTLKLYFEQWAPVEEDLYELELLGDRYHILSVVQTRAYRLVTAERVIT